MNKMKVRKNTPAPETNAVCNAEWLKWLPLVQKNIRKILAKQPVQGSHTLDAADLEYEAYLVLRKCREGYREEKGCSFSTYFSNALQHELWGKIRRCNKTMFSGTGEGLKLVDRAYRRCKEEGREFSPEALRHFCPDGKPEILNRYYEVWRSNRAGDSAGEVYKNRTQQDEEDTAAATPAEQADYSERCRSVRRLFAVLTHAEQLILSTLIIGKQEGKVCERLQITRPTFRRRKEKLLERLRRDPVWAELYASMA